MAHGEIGQGFMNLWGDLWLVVVKNRQQTSSLQQSVEHAIREYLSDLDGEIPHNLFQTVISEIEQPLLQTVMKYCNNNQCKTASYLGINRGTLRKKLKHYQIEH
jgi:Fis family transcriptional regulator